MTTTRVRPLRSEVREQIVAAAGEEFAERGYGGTSVAQVAARAGFTKGAVYSNFGGKPELFAAAMQAYFAGAVVGAFDDALGARGDRDRPSRRPRAMARALAENVAAGGALADPARRVPHRGRPRTRPARPLRRAPRSPSASSSSTRCSRAGEQVALRGRPRPRGGRHPAAHLRARAVGRTFRRARRGADRAGRGPVHPRARRDPRVSAEAEAATARSSVEGQAAEPSPQDRSRKIASPPSSRPATSASSGPRARSSPTSRSTVRPGAADRPSSGPGGSGRSSLLLALSGRMRGCTGTLLAQGRRCARGRDLPRAAPPDLRGPDRHPRAARGRG